MSESLAVFAVLAFAAALAGAINSVAGGGTLLTFPALQQVLARHGLADASVWANATSTVALFPGSLAGAFAYRRELAQCRRLILILLAPSLLGGIVGALLVTMFPSKVFDALVPWLILTAAVLFLLQGPIKRLTGSASHCAPNARVAVIVCIGQFLIAVYGGYFGAGIGILMLSVLPFMGTKTIHETNAAKTILAASINAVTAVVFVIEGVVRWDYALLMAVSAIVGGYLGAHYARKLPAIYVRGLVITIGFGLGVYYLVR